VALSSPCAFSVDDILMSLFSLVSKIRPRALILGALRQWMQQRVSSKAAALAMYMIFSLAPMLILVMAVAAVFFGDQTVRVELVERLRDLVGERGAEVIQIVLASAHESKGGWAAALLSIVVLMLSATSAFHELKQSLDELWWASPDTPPRVQAQARRPASGIRMLVQARVRAFALVLVLALFLLASLMASAALSTLQHHYGELWTHASMVLVGDYLARVFSFVIVVALFAVVFKLLPDSDAPWLHVIPGAMVTAGLFLIGKWGIGLYLSHSSIASAYGVTGSVVVLLLWIYYSSLMFFFGAVLTRQYVLQMAEGSA